MNSPDSLLVRLQKFLADAGAGSRRGCEALIRDGRVQVNGQLVRLLGSKVDPLRDRVQVDGQPLQAQRKYHVALHKPPGYVCSRRGQGPHPLVMDLLPSEWRGLYPVGRLDRESEGLLLLSNDGEFCLRTTHPRFGIRKTYRVGVVGRVTPEIAAALLQGVKHRGERLRAAAATVLSANNSRSRVEVVLTEGRNREVRRLFAALGLHVERLVRVQIGPVRLGELPSGKWRMLQPAEVRALMQPGPVSRDSREGPVSGRGRGGGRASKLAAAADHP